MGQEKRVEKADQQQMTEETRHKFNRLTFYTLLLAFLGVTMTFVIFSSVSLANITCSQGQAVTAIGTISDTCGFPISGSDSCSGAIGAFFCRKTVTYPAFASLPKVIANAKSCAGGSVCSHTSPLGQFISVDFIDENTTWVNMPVATTPFDGDTSGTFSQIVDFTKIGEWRIQVVCPTASNSVTTPLLTAQWSNDGGATWRFLGPSQVSFSGASVVIDGFGNNNGVGGQCGLGGYNNVVESCIGGVASPCSGWIAIDPNLNYLTSGLDHILIRIVGVNGGGIGDLPVFSRVVLNFGLLGTINDNRDVLSNGFFCEALSGGQTVTSTVIECDIIGVVSPQAFTISFNWQATL